jgi:hypothetical protein
VKLTTGRTAASRLFFAACLVLAPGLSRANTVKVSELPGGAGMGGGTTENSVAARAGTLTADLLSLLSAAEMKSFNRTVSEQYFTSNDARPSSSESYSIATFTAPASFYGGKGLSARYSMPEPQLIAWNLTRTRTTYQPIPQVAGEDVAAESIIGGTAGGTTGNKHNKVTTAIVSNGASNPFVQKDSDFGLSIAGASGVDQIRKVVLALDAGGDAVGGSAVPEPRFNFLLLAGMMTAAVIYRRRSRHV